ncbi:MAG TPA: alpha-E domain-containing protein [Polyangiaceae bacterium]|nr:alpha-E domain-containing protein [Polyangiaceae bacterium]
MLSRVADALYWMGRYVERAEHAARVLRVSQGMLLELSEVSPRSGDPWKGTLEALALPDISFASAVFDEGASGSVVSSLYRARENARQVREVISSEMWEALNETYWALKEAAEAPEREADMNETLADVVEGGFAFAGVADGTMRRGEGWLFTRLGQFMERADKVSRVVRVQYRAATEHGDDNLIWMPLLRACSALEVFRKVHGTRLDRHHVVDFLVLDQEFPHTVRYSVNVVGEFAQRLSRAAGERGSDVDRAFGRLSSRLKYTQLADIEQAGVDVFLNGLCAELAGAAMVLQRAYFQH